MSQPAYLILENGRLFTGTAFGAGGEAVGELVFTTAMTGYLETLTDPSYYGQIVVQTFPLIGNYGVISPDFESTKPHLKAYIVRQWCQAPSNFRSEGELDAFLKTHNILAMEGVDTRALTRIVREHGVMNAKIIIGGEKPEVTPALLESLAAHKSPPAVPIVSPEKNILPGDNAGKEGALRVALWDFGSKANIKRELEKRGCVVDVVPSGASAEDILALSPDGLMLSNGPGDPAENTAIIAQLQKVMDKKIPTFGICLGHQLLALSQGAKTHKLKYGHRGANQPAKETKTGRVYVTSQNHGYAVSSETLPATASVSFVNVNDGTCEGVEYHNLPAFSVQFHPEASAGPLDTRFLFDQFIERMKEDKSNAPA